jgi:hypothetical protein
MAGVRCSRMAGVVGTPRCTKAQAVEMSDRPAVATITCLVQLSLRSQPVCCFCVACR